MTTEKTSEPVPSNSGTALLAFLGSERGSVAERVFLAAARRLFEQEYVEECRLSFRGADMTMQHGESGKTRREILREYEEELERWKRALASVQGKP